MAHKLALKLTDVPGANKWYPSASDLFDATAQQKVACCVRMYDG